MEMENNTYLNANDVICIIRELSYSQGFYGRLYRAINELKVNNPDCYNDFCEMLNNQYFTDTLDVIFYFET